ncbi:MAG: hypothetical protein OXH57_10955 [Ekhidna sp.]|nr:hypothetical protein [Ekhidna sp.]
MIKTFTENDLIRFVYNEINEDERLDLTQSLQSDMRLRSRWKKINEAKSLLAGFTLKAPKSVTSGILYVSKNFQSS